jgi:hypothetical protein
MLTKSNKPNQPEQHDPFVPGVNTRFPTQTTMEVNGLKVTLNMPKAVERKKDSQGNEITQGLPPYNQRPAYVVDEYPACPDNWMHGNSKSSSYFVPIMPEHGMWLDFQQNMYYRKTDSDGTLSEWDIAAVVSVQGINPLTGMKSDPIRLERYQEKCPKHEKEFGQERFCEDCKFKWHPQNYLCSNNGSPFWIDGFRTEDGTIRQWYFTEEECKGIAAQVLGDERVFAIGIAFYLSKKPKPKPTYTSGYGFGGNISYGGWQPLGDIYSKQLLGNDMLESTVWNCVDSNANITTCSAGSTGSIGISGVQGPTGKQGPIGPKKGKKGKKVKTRRTRGIGGQSMNKALPEEAVFFVGAAQTDIAAAQKTLEIGAGAKISQQINPDPQDLDYWQEEAAGFIYINYCDVDTAQKILTVGKREEIEEGFLAGLEIKD